MDPQASPGAELSRDYMLGLETIRRWKTFFLVLTLLALATHVGAFVAVRHFNIISAPPADDASAAAATTQRADSERAHDILAVALPSMEFVGRATALLVSLALLLACFVALAGRLPAAGFIRGFFWSLIVLALLLPWERLTPRAARMPGVFTDVAALESAVPGATPGPTGLTDQIPFHMRFVAYPVVAAALLVFANGGFRRSYRDAQSRPGGSIPMRVV
ncbi:MAG: hypothetical protein U1A27_08845 [Phycisphaerae bacterium]